MQEENNLRSRWRAPTTDAANLYTGPQYGFARYEHIKDYDFGPGERYFARTEPFWAEVRAAWRELERRDGGFTLRAQSDQGQLFMQFFEYAEKLSGGGAFDRADARAFVERTLRDTYLSGPIKSARSGEQ